MATNPVNATAKPSEFVKGFVHEAVTDFISSVGELPEEQKPSLEHLEKLQNNIAQNARELAQQIEAKGLNPEAMAAESHTALAGLKEISAKWETYENNFKEWAARIEAMPKPKVKVKPILSWSEKLSKNIQRNISDEASNGQRIFTSASIFLGSMLVLDSVIGMVAPKKTTVTQEDGTVIEKSNTSMKRQLTQLAIGAGTLGAGLLVNIEGKGRL